MHKVESFVKQISTIYVILTFNMEYRRLNHFNCNTNRDFL